MHRTICFPIASLLIRRHRNLHHSLAAAVSTTASSPPPPPCPPRSSLSPYELTEINRLIPRLLDSGHLDVSLSLLDAALFGDPDPSSLPISTLADRLADMEPTMSLLTLLRQHPRRPSPLPYAAALISAYIARCRHKEVLEVILWLCSSDSTSRPDLGTYALAIEGFAKIGRPLEAVKVVREMIGDGITAGNELRGVIYRALLMDARVDEARELEEVLKKVAEEGGVAAAREFVDRMIKNWEE